MKITFKEMIILTVITAFSLGLTIVATIKYFEKKNQLIECENTVNGATDSVNFLQFRLDEKDEENRRLQAEVNALTKQLINKDSIIKIINQKYEKKFNYITTLSVDGNIEFFSNYLSKEDSIGSGYSCSDTSRSAKGLQFFVR